MAESLINNSDSGLEKKIVRSTTDNYNNGIIDTRRINAILYPLEKFLWMGWYFWGGMKNTSKNHLEIPDSTGQLIRDHYKYKDIAIMFVPLHKDFEETIFFPEYIYEVLGGDITRVIMNTEKVTKPALKFILTSSGVYSFNTTSRDAGVQAMQITRRVLTNNGLYTYFGEGKRSRDGNVGPFGIAGFHAALQAAEKTKAVYIVPVDMTCQHVDDIINGKKQSYGVREVLGAFKVNYGNKYISFGEPIKVVPIDKRGLTDTEIEKAYRVRRAELAKQTRDACLDLKVILNEHIHAKALVNLNSHNNHGITLYEELDSVREVVKELLPLKDKFRGVNINNPTNIISNSVLNRFQAINKDGLYIHGAYANNLNSFYNRD